MHISPCCLKYDECDLTVADVLRGTYYENNTFPGIWGVGLGLCSHTHTNFEISLYMIFLSEICISESTPPAVTQQASQFRRPLLRWKGSHLNITSNLPTPVQSERG